MLLRPRCIPSRGILAWFLVAHNGENSDRTVAKNTGRPKESPRWAKGVGTLPQARLGSITESVRSTYFVRVRDLNL